MRLLLVEDDSMIGESIRKGLRQDGFAVDWAQDGAQAETALKCESYEAVLLDLGLPRKDGFSLLRELRRSPCERIKRVPVLVLTARGAVADRVRGLDFGADDYLVKPFDLSELSARVRALLRRQAGRSDPVVRFGKLSLDTASRKVTYEGREVPLSSREYALLEALAARPGAPFSRRQLEERLYGWGEEVASNAIEVHVHNLRKKLGEGAIRTVRGVGYALAGGEAACPSVANSS